MIGGVRSKEFSEAQLYMSKRVATWHLVSNPQYGGIQLKLSAVFSDSGNTFKRSRLLEMKIYQIIKLKSEPRSGLSTDVALLSFDPSATTGGKRNHKTIIPNLLKLCSVTSEFPN